MKKLVLCLVLVVFSATFCFAQNDEYSKGEVFAGYSNGTLYEGSGFEPNQSGFEVSGVYNFNRFLGLKVDATGTYSNLRSTTNAGNISGTTVQNRSLYNISAGLQVKNNSKQARIKPFGHILAGYGSYVTKFNSTCSPNCSSFNGTNNQSGVSIVLGAGLDIKLNRSIDFRVIQYDVNPLVVNSGRNIYINNRLSTGIVFKF